jgi:lipopolysaccharide transport system ATP-binding protein
MSGIAIKVEGLSKRYSIGVRQESYKTLRDTITDVFTAPFRKRRQPHKREGSEENLSVHGPASLPSSNSHIWALKDVSLEVKHGEVVGIIGRNGAGKTTLLKILSRITEPTEGYAEINGRIGSLLEVGTGFHPELTGRENIYLSGAILGMRKTEIDRRFDDIVAFSEIEKFLDTPVKRYSSGMYVRLAFAVAAHLETEILLVDEVLAVGDAAFQKKCLGKMGNVVREGRTVLFVSHNMAAITSLCDRAIWLDGGSFREDGTSERTVSNYLGSIRKRQSITEGRVSLHHHPGRRKGFDQVVSIHECQLLDDHGQPVPHFMSGREARIRIEYRGSLSPTNVAITFVCAFRNSQGQRIAYCSSDVVGADFTGLQPNGAVECIIPKLSFFPGTYSIDIGCKVGNGWSDFIYEAVEAEVMDGGFYATKLLPPDGEGNLLLEYVWDVPKG